MVVGRVVIYKKTISASNKAFISYSKVWYVTFNANNTKQVFLNPHPTPEANICRCLPPDGTWLKDNDQKVD